MGKELSRRVVLERIVRRGQRAAFEAAVALEEIYRDRLYRDTHSSFEQYCVEVFDISVSTGKRMLVQARESLEAEASTGQREPFAPETKALSQREAAARTRARAIETSATSDPPPPVVSPGVDDPVESAGLVPDDDIEPPVEPVHVVTDMTVHSWGPVLRGGTGEVISVGAATGVALIPAHDLADALGTPDVTDPDVLLAKVRALVAERQRWKAARQVPDTPLTVVDVPAGHVLVNGEPVEVKVEDLKYRQPSSTTCLHPRDKYRRLDYGTFCGVCNMKVR